MSRAEFGVMKRDGEWLIVWYGCDGRTLARCPVRREAMDMCAALNKSGLSAKWYALAKVGLGLEDAR